MRVSNCVVGVVAAVMLAACGSNPQQGAVAPTASVEPSSTADPPPMATNATTTTTAATEATTTSVDTAGTGRLRVTQHQTDCCYTEGQVSSLIVRDTDGISVADRDFQGLGEIEAVVDLRLPPGTYAVESYQRPCDGNCSQLDAITDDCTLRVDIGAAEEHFLTVEFAPGKGCTIASTDEPLASPVPDEFALREDYPSCGTDFGLIEPPDGNNGQERQCFIDANDARHPAELAAYEAGATADSPDFFVYRSNADGSVVVFRPNLGRTSDGPWRRFTCTGLVHDEARGFDLTGCTASVVLAAAGGPTSSVVNGTEPVVLDLNGGCNEASFWARNDEGTSALLLSITVDRSAEGPVDIAVDLPDPAIYAELQHGTDLGQSLCGDVVTPPYHVSEDLPIASGHLVIHLERLPRSCDGGGPPNGTVDVTNLVAIDGTRIADMTLQTSFLGCYVG
jgi:hypothetical protein